MSSSLEQTQRHWDVLSLCLGVNQRTNPAQLLLSAQAALILVQLEPGVNYFVLVLLWWSGLWWVSPHNCCAMTYLSPVLAFSLPLCLPCHSSLLQNKQPNRSLVYFFSNCTSFSTSTPKFGVSGPGFQQYWPYFTFLTHLPWALLSLGHSPLGLQHFPQLIVKFFLSESSL